MSRKEFKVVTAEPSTEIVHKEVQVILCRQPKPLRASKAMDLLGWKTETENVKFKDDYLLKDVEGNKVRCLANVGNRPYRHSRTRSYTQDILRRRWQFNGHSRIISKEGHILSGQHVLAALVLAKQEWEKHPGKWKDFWIEEPYIETLVVLGIESTDEVKNTIDTARESTLTDVLFRSHHFEDIPRSHREALAKVCNFGVRLLWDRVDQRNDAYAPYRSRSEEVDFLNRHLKLCDCARHIYEHNSDRAISRYISTGAAAGLMFLMGAAATEPAKYYAGREKTEGDLDWSLWDQAESFWVLLAGSSPEMNAVHQQRQKMLDEGANTPAEQEALIIKAWNRYVTGEKIRERDLTLQYEMAEDDLDRPSLAEHPRIGGIDRGPVAEEDEPEEPEPPKKSKPKAKAPKAKLRPHRANEDTWSEGDVAYVEDADGDVYLARVLEPPYATDTDGYHVLVAEGGDDTKRYEVSLDQLSLVRP